MLSVIWKELKVLFSKPISIIILLVYPLLLVYLLGIGFSGHNISLDVGLSVQDNNLDKNLLTNSFNGFGVRPIFTNFDINNPTSYLQNAFLYSPIFVTMYPLNLGTYATKIYYEDLDFFVGKSGTQLTENAIMSLANQISLKKITVMTDQIKALREILLEQKTKLENYSLMLDDTNKELTGIKEKLNTVNFSEIRKTLSDKQNDLNDISYKLDDLKQDKQTLETAYLANKQLVDTLDSMYGYFSALNVDMNTLQNQSLALSLLLLQLQNNNIDLNNFDINSFTGSLNLVNNDLSNIVATINDANTKAAQSTLGLGQFVEDFNSTFALVTNDVNDTNQLLINLSEKINEVESDFNYVNSVVNSSLEKQANIKQDLNTSIAMLDSLVLQLSPEKFDPEPIANPIKLEKESMYSFFKSKDIAVIFGIVLVLLFNAILLVSMSGVKDKTQGIDVREKLSPKNRIYFFLGRFFSQSIVGLLTAIIMIIFAVIVFGFPLMHIGYLLLYLILSIFAFVAIGLFISVFVDSESIAILLSLLIVMPMLFLSGLILPTYFMPSALSSIANVLPLTLGKNALINAIVGKSALVPGLILLGYTIVFLALVYVFRKR